MSFKRFDAEDIAISADSITAPVWSTGAPTLTTFEKSSVQYAAKNQYHVNVFQTTYTDADAEVQFDISYADKAGSGTTLYNPSVAGKSPSSTIYGQYRSLVLGDEESDFVFNSGTISENFYVISINRSRFKEKLLPGTFNLTLGTTAGSITLTDNSKDVTVVSFKDSGRVYNVVQGTNGSGGSDSYGWFLPDIGTILLDAAKLDAAAVDGGISLGTVRGTNANSQNSDRLLSALTSFKLNSEETVTSNYVFVRVRNGEFNYSVNPSNITGSGDLRHDYMIDAPQAYVTSVGLYNDNNDLLAVAKLSKPLVKDFTKEALLRIKLDF